MLFNLSGSTSDGESKGQTSSKTVDVLFIGNSLTSTNNLPKLLERRAKQSGILITTKMIALPDYAIVDHWEDGEIQKLIITKNYEYVIIQQGPSSQDFGKQLLFEYGEKLNILCRNNDAELCFFMVWPSLEYYHTFDGVIKNYTEIAERTNSILCPVGKIWKDHFDSTENFDYYGKDGFHPSVMGSQVAADVIFESIFK